jgi:alkanesulfonate monooxygenase SsuD/methylene tetrahydromethanopterin reductase-like flavin-dependent oxidoreductase (luciferase family)
MSRPLLGLNVPIAASATNLPIETAVTAERLGFDFLSLNDHPEGETPCHELWTLLTWLAAHTKRIRVATRVMAVPFRSPAMVAKMAATLAHLAPGRVILGLGGGSGDSEMRAFGVDVPGPAEKIERLAEATRVIRGLWTSPSFTFAGRHYRVADATIAPTPAPPVPIWFGTFGPRALRITGEIADGWIPSLGYAPDDKLPRMRDSVLAAAAAAGRDPSRLTCVLNLVVRTDQEVPEPGTVSGHAESIAARLQGLLDMGFHGFNFVLSGPEPLDDAHMLVEQLIPQLNAAEGVVT